MKHLVIILCWFIISGTTIWGQSSQDQDESLSYFQAVPEFMLTERSGRIVGLPDLHNKVWIVNFIYTHCPDSCPIQSAKMAQLQKTFAQENNLRLVSITIDPERDTPEILRKYADQFEADPERWLFLTGTKEEIYELAFYTFMVPIQPFMFEEDEENSDEKPTNQQSQRSPQSSKVISVVIKSWLETLSQWFPPSAAFAHGKSEVFFMHSSRFILVDRQGDIRGYYDSNNDQEMEILKQHVRLLLKQ